VERLIIRARVIMAAANCSPAVAAALSMLATLGFQRSWVHSQDRTKKKAADAQLFSRWVFQVILSYSKWEDGCHQSPVCQILKISF
jgi:hypothetical protein